MTVSAPLSAAARGAQRLGILGGSFDPPHLGHLHIAQVAARAFALDHVLFVPAAHPPHKPDRELAPGLERLAMLDLLLMDEPRCSTWSGELSRPGPSYSIDTVRELRAQLPPTTALFLILGADNLADLPRWHAAPELLALVQPIAVAREGDVLDLDPAAYPELSPAQLARLAKARVDAPPLTASSSAAREALAAGRDPGPALPPQLVEYLRERGIYSGS